ncbi:MAG: hydrogenase formation protein HypD [Saccharofermentanales bacterium]
MEIDYIKYLYEYDGPPLKIMEVCGTHTAEISRCGIPAMISPSINLVSGPGCPVCVTVTAYIDRLAELAESSKNVIVTFGDMMRVKGKTKSLSDIKADGGQVRMVYSPLDILNLAAADKTRDFIFAAIGFETTTPVYAMLIEEIINNNIKNIKLLTSLKTMPAAIDWICRNQNGIDGFLAPGHVSTITGSKMFESLAAKYRIPFAVAGFTGQQILMALAALVKNRGFGRVMNLYTASVTRNGNEIAQSATDRYFLPANAAWRGFGVIPDSGMVLRDEYMFLDAGSEGLDDDRANNPKCLCAEVLTGSISPARCTLFGNECTPQSQQGACMVSSEGSCYNYYINKR